MIKRIVRILILINLILIGCNNKEIIMENGLIIEDKLIGEGVVAEKYSIATVHYTGRLEKGNNLIVPNKLVENRSDLH